jgi:hypothetical protein
MKKGQSRIFEHVLLFGISVAIFVACFGIFQLYQSYFSSISVNDHAMAVRDMIHTHMMELTRLENLNASIVLKIPKEISGEGYRIMLNNTDIAVITEETGVTAAARLYTISEDLYGDYSFSGEAASSKGEIIIYKRGHNIIIE